MSEEILSKDIQTLTETIKKLQSLLEKIYDLELKKWQRRDTGQ